MRLIKFRGKTELTGEWVYGFFSMGAYVPTNPDQGEQIVPRYIIDDGLLHDVVPDSVGQFTGFIRKNKDGNDVEVYEGDIVHVYGGTINYDYYSVVRWDEHGGCWYLRDDLSLFVTFGLLNKALVTIVGNIYDNPELIDK